MQTDNRVDVYIEKAAPFAQAIMNHLRQLVHKACPEVTETIKWGFPHFDYRGEMMCSMAAFKQHCAFTFWKGSLLSRQELLQQHGETAMGHLGRITQLGDLPSNKDLIGLIKEAMLLNDKGIKLVKKPKAPTAEITVPEFMTSALKQHKAAWHSWENFAPSHRKEYTQWITEAKTEATRQRRLQQAIEWIAEGKGRNWQYEKKS